MAKKDEIKINRKHKDSLFRFIFKGDNERSRRWLLSLYNALRGSNYQDPGLLEITTLEDVIYINIKNDLSFLINDEMNLFEQQSTVNPNMPVRGLMYFSKLYENYITNNELNVHSGSLIKLPTPKYIVFYNGERKIPDIVKYHLSDAFVTADDSKEFEWTATVLNVNANHNPALQKNCKALYDYSEFIARIRQNVKNKNHMSFSDAVNEAMDYAIEHNFLEGFFKEEKAKVMDSILTQFDKEVYEKSLRQEGKEEKAIEDATNALKLGLSDEQIIAITGLSSEKLAELKKQE